MTVEFWKDDVKNVRAKTCGDYVTDARWFKANHPRMILGQMHLYYVVVERLGTDAFAKHIGMAAVESVGARLPAAFDAVYENCAANPRANFLVTLRSRLGIDW